MVSGNDIKWYNLIILHNLDIGQRKFHIGQQKPTCRTIISVV